jgi:cyclopropane fatty-acyl-phospholipid synthase-like methyltransferase
MSRGRFDTDTSALERRIHAHDAFGSHDLNSWILANLHLAPGLHVLELGCGVGKQTLPIAKEIGGCGHITALDLSREALDMLASRAHQQGLAKRISPQCGDLDDLGSLVNGVVFDRALGSYSLYYGKHPQTLFCTIVTALRPGGVLFFCGPSGDNNAELKHLHYSLLSERPVSTDASAFMEETGPQLASELFSEVHISKFENRLRFTSSDDLYSYWSSYNLYSEDLADAFRCAAEKHFRSHGIFETVKRVVGIKATK